MKKLFILALSLTLGLNIASAQTSTPASTQKVVTDGPVITFAESKYDFGSIKEGDIVKHTFKFKNTGNQPLVVSAVNVTCGCTTPDWTKTPVAPGQSGFIVAQFNSSGKVGMNSKTITVVSNSVTGNQPLTFTANAKARTENSSVAPAAATVTASTTTKATSATTTKKATTKKN